ncbi:MAG: hypothetical protein HPY57_15460 [Ignavibacteria bacterium]|nr:hypothetical protein [Ignavibacteria bacterium]
MVVAKNCVPIIDINVFKYYTYLGDVVLFNFPRRYDNDSKTMDRIEECLSGDIKREISHIIGNKVFHSLMIKDGKTPTKENDTFHTYDRITKKLIYDTFSKRFEIMFRYTNGGVWCLMIKNKNMKILNDYNEKLQSIYDYFGFAELLKKYPIDSKFIYKTRYSGILLLKVYCLDESFIYVKSFNNDNIKNYYSYNNCNTLDREQELISLSSFNKPILLTNLSIAKTKLKQFEKKFIK